MSAQQKAEGRRALEVVVCLQDSIVDVIHVRGEGTVLAGTTEECHIPLPQGFLGEGVDSVVVAQAPEVGRPEVTTAIAAGAALRPMNELESVTLQVGPMKIFVREVVDAPAAPRKWVNADRRVLGMVVGSIAAHALALMVLFAIPPESHGASFAGDYRLSRNKVVQMKPNEDPRKELEPGKSGENASSSDPTGAQAHEGKDGQIGKPEVKDRGGSIRVKGRSPEIVLGGDNKAQAKEAGVFKAWKGSRRWGVSDEQAMGPFDDDSVGTEGQPGDGGGHWGAQYYADNNGPGGCKVGMYCGPKTIGVDGYIPGNSRDPNTGDPRKRPPGFEDDRKPMGPVVTIKKPVVTDDGLDAEIIRREVRAHRAELQYCYEKQLLANPELAGTVVVKFTIGANGLVEVVTIESSSAGPEVAQCVARQVRTWKFPPTTGSRTHVKYPFEFRVAGSK